MTTISVAQALSERAVNQHRAVQKPDELAELIDLFKSEDFTPSRVLEIGTDRGGTLWLWCKLATGDATVVSVDIDGGTWSSGAQNTPELLKYAAREQSLHLIKGDSHGVSAQKRVRRVYPTPTVDLLFLDGDHSFDGTARDYWTYAKLVREGGMIVFHDIAADPVDHTVKVGEFWARIRPRYRDWWQIICEPADWGGFGVVRVGR